MRGKNTFVYLCASFSAFGGLLFGYDLGVISGVLTMPYFREKFPSGPAKEGSIVSSFLAGCFVGALFSGYSADKLGRRMSILVGSLTFIVGGILQATSESFAQLYIGRVISGTSIGILSTVVPMYQSEISPKEIRGRLVSLQQWSITIGIAVAFWIDYATGEINSPQQWRIPLWVQCVPAAVLALGIVFLPRSPRWLLDYDRNDEALTVLSKLRANGDKNDPAVISEYNEIKDNIRFERENASKGYAELLKRGPENIRRRIFLGIFIQIFQQLTGINAIMYYAPQIFTNAGLTSNSSKLLATGVNGIVNVLATIPEILWIDRWGRRPTMISGGLLMALCMTTIGSVLAVHGTKYYDNELGKNFVRLDSNASSYSIIAFIYLFVASFAYSWGPCGWIYPAEIYPLRIRGKALSITTAANWLLNLVVGQVTPTLLDSITWGTYIIFGSFCLIMTVSIFLFYPETKGKSLEEMDMIFGSISTRSSLEPSTAEKGQAPALIQVPGDDSNAQELGKTNTGTDG
ncbi:9192_t:CDS:10 [Acaulospora morrowiae]|uniref:9192_t:CDS:1 n=1 Tax=Acaulospora morrowiae TaxID=94023 RepID=A0A9N8ZIH7_9GLOM|nr:9192_t:CDS:10 [Acaulospora morrowiae]